MSNVCFICFGHKTTTQTLCNACFGKHTGRCLKCNKVTGPVAFLCAACDKKKDQFKELTKPVVQHEPDSELVQKWKDFRATMDHFLHTKQQD